MTFVDEDVRSIGIRYVDDNRTLQDLQIILPVTVALSGGGAVHALLCRSVIPATVSEVNPGEDGARWLVYYDRNADRMVAHRITTRLLGDWLKRVGA